MGLLGQFEKIKKIGKSFINVVKPSGFFNQNFEKIHFQRNYMWEIVLPTFMRGVIPMPGIIISKLCQSIIFEDYIIDGTSDTTRFGAFEAKYPGLLTIGPITLTFLKTTPDVVTTYFTQWRKLMISDSGLYAKKSDYAKTMYLIFLDTTGIITNRYKFINVFPLSMPAYNLNYTDDKLTSIDIKLNVDKIEVLY